MSMRRLIPLALGLAFLVSAATAAIPFPHETSDLKLDPTAKDGSLLSTEEVEQERGIILSEKRARDSVGYRTSIAKQRFMLRGTMFAKRDVIGTDEDLKHADPERFLDFYDA